MKNILFGFLGGLFIGLLIICSHNNKNKDIESIPIKLQQPEFFLSDSPTDSLLYQACVYYDIYTPEVVIAQAILETGHYCSEICKRDNNLFGLYNSRKKEYFKFKHWTESVKAYKDMIQYKYKYGEDYHIFLDRIGYAEDSLYNNKLKNIIKRYGLSEIYKKK